MYNFIVNAHSGRGRGQRTLQKLINLCYKHNIEYTVHLTSAKGHATRIAKALCENDAHTLIAVGGDGTFHEVLNGIIDPEKTALGFIPSGRGNDFARGAGIPLCPKKALKNIILNKEKRIDVLSVGGIRCLNVSGTGLDVDVLQRVDGKNGKITYLKGLLYSLKHFEPYDFTVAEEGKEPKQYHAIVVATANGTQYGGGIKISPLSSIDDGKLNVVIMEMPKDGRIFHLLPAFLRGKHLKMPITTHYLTENVHIKMDKPYPVQLDGEIYENLDFDCKVEKGLIRTFL